MNGSVHTIWDPDQRYQEEWEVSLGKDDRDLGPDDDLYLDPDQVEEEWEEEHCQKQ